jgi:DNA-binding transcriptional LysR family regulator
LEAISEKKLDLGIVIGGKIPPDIQYYSIYKDQYKLVATPQFLEKLTKPIQWEDIKDAPLIFPLINAPRAVQLQLAHIGQKLNMVSTIDIIHPIAAKEFVKTGHYVGCLLQSTIAEELKQGILQEIILNEMDWPKEEVEYYVIWKGALSDKARQFLNFVMEYEFN